MKKLTDSDLQQLSILLIKLGKENLKLTGLQLFQLANIELGVRGYELSEELKNKLYEESEKHTSLGTGD